MNSFGASIVGTCGGLHSFGPSTGEGRRSRVVTAYPSTATRDVKPGSSRHGVRLCMWLWGVRRCSRLAYVLCSSVSVTRQTRAQTATGLRLTTVRAAPSRRCHPCSTGRVWPSALVTPCALRPNQAWRLSRPICYPYLAERNILSALSTSSAPDSVSTPAPVAYTHRLHR